MERMGVLHEELQELVGEEEGIRLLVQVMDVNGPAAKLQRKQGK
jgi:hypothetical protein